ncbi:conidiation-specific protein (Con-10), putative [Paecilomyces variotii No. 5]|uniref:Conidiation-specific protein (Con-10), putative n=1 Tax=Byssochlamys spectabilis (strain No. 5 / NBRC 109023) TaxID=1356009 RepID=V5FHI6_BYSSN|nr:conidiation-specific protein (Con-10), putative [Paecilomyces variotii No. 5]
MAPTHSGAAQSNPGNFANRSHEEVENIARKGGQHSHQGGFHHMDPDKQRDIASKGGHASGGSFQPGDPRAREAGRKGGSRTSDYEPEE